METVTPAHYLVLSLILFAIGFFGVLLRRNLLLVLMSLELMLNGINLALVNFSRTALNLDGSTLIPDRDGRVGTRDQCPPRGILGSQVQGTKDGEKVSQDQKEALQDW